jgi:hypothetical protein
MEHHEYHMSVKLVGPGRKLLLRPAADPSHREVLMDAFSHPSQA